MTIRLSDSESLHAGAEELRASLRESQTLLASVLESSLTGIMVFQAVRDEAGALIDFHWLLVNPAAVRAAGRPLSDLLGRRLSAVYPESWPLGLFDRYVQVVETGEPQVFEQRFERDGKTRHSMVSVVKVGDGFAASYENVTESRLAHEALLRLSQAQSDFISTVSHELRTPLTSIRGALALLAGNVTGPLPDAARPMVDIALRNSERLLALINDLLDIQRIESGSLDLSLQEVELTCLLEQALEDNHAFGAQLGVTYRLIHGEPELWVQGDPNRLLQLLANLLSNAAKFSPPQGTVEIAAERHGGWARVSVRDHGPGIPEEFWPRIFTRFAQADSSNSRQRGGTGLGLSICKALVERMGGRIGFETDTESAAGHGTTFHFELPLIAAASEP
jgi:signal transduction histidine kinase